MKAAIVLALLFILSASARKRNPYTTPAGSVAAADLVRDGMKSCRPPLF